METLEPSIVSLCAHYKAKSLNYEARDISFIPISLREKITWGKFDGLVLALKPKQLWDKSRNYFFERVGNEIDEVTVEEKESNVLISLRNELEILSYKDFTKLLFGTLEKNTENASDLWVLMKRCLPLPLANYGIAYI